VTYSLTCTCGYEEAIPKTPGLGAADAAMDIALLHTFRAPGHKVTCKVPANWEADGIPLAFFVVDGDKPTRDRITEIHWSRL
jgi:hypothetical protein